MSKEDRESGTVQLKGYVPRELRDDFIARCVKNDLDISKALRRLLRRIKDGEIKL